VLAEPHRRGEDRRYPAALIVDDYAHLTRMEQDPTMTDPSGEPDLGACALALVASSEAWANGVSARSARTNAPTLGT
jgi:hypothetical protein